MLFYWFYWHQFVGYLSGSLLLTKPFQFLCSTHTSITTLYSLKTGGKEPRNSLCLWLSSCADRSSWQYFNIVRSYSVAEHSASLLSVVRVSWFYCWTKSRLSFSRAWGESVVVFGGLFIFKVLTVSAAPHSVPWNLGGKNHATAFVCDCLVVLTVLAVGILISD